MKKEAGMRGIRKCRKIICPVLLFVAIILMFAIIALFQMKFFPDYQPPGKDWPEIDVNLVVPVTDNGRYIIIHDKITYDNGK